MKEKCDHSRYIRLIAQRFPLVAEEIAVRHIMYISDAQLESVFNHAGRVDSLRRTHWAAETLEALTASIVQREDVEPHLENAVRAWGGSLDGWDRGLLPDSEATVLDGVDLTQTDEHQPEFVGDPLGHSPLIDDAEIPVVEREYADSVRDEDDAFPLLVPFVP